MTMVVSFGWIFLALPVAIPLFFSGRRAAACFVLGGALSVTTIAFAVIWALNPDPGTNAPGLALWGLLALASVGVLAGARRPAAQIASFSTGVACCFALIAAAVYFVTAFRIF